jgi:hypothetical protein
MKNSAMPAMPLPNEDLGLGGGELGITKREMMAMHMMASLSRIYWDTEEMYDSGESLIKCQAESAVEMADALLAELERTK